MSKAMASSVASDVSGTKRPSFPMPDCWKDENRVAALLAPFRLRSVNMEHFDAKMKFWQDLIAEYCEHKRDASFTRREIQMQFASGEVLPACLEDVIAELQNTKKIRPRAEYEYDPLNTWSGWVIKSFIKNPLNWGMGRIKQSVGWTEESLQSGVVKYVHVEVIEKLCKRLQASVFPPHQGKLLHYDAFVEICAPQGLTEDALNLCLHTLHCQLKIGLEYQQRDQQRVIHLVKIPAAGAAHAMITPTDRAVHNLQMTEQNLLKEMETLQTDIKLNERKARDCLKENKRQLAKTFLRKKHLLEKNHEKRSVALHNIETLLSSVEETQSNGEVLDAYKIGSQALQHALDSSGLKYDNVDEVVAEVRDSIETHRELQDALGNVSVAENLSMYDNDDLERELQEIMGEKPTTPAKAQPATPAKAQPATPAKKQPVRTPTNNNYSNTFATETAASSPNPPVTRNYNTLSNVKVAAITESDLLAMLEDLEVEEGSVKSAALA